LRDSGYPRNTLGYKNRAIEVLFRAFFGQFCVTKIVLRARSNGGRNTHVRVEARHAPTNPAIPPLAASQSRWLDSVPSGLRKPQAAKPRTLWRE
jgi:hypothetical protein